MQTTLSFPSSPCSWAVCNWRPTSARYPEARDEHSQHDGKGGEMDSWGVPGAISLGDIRKFTGTTKAATQPGAPTRAHTCSSTHSHLKHLPDPIRSPGSRQQPGRLSPDCDRKAGPPTPRCRTRRLEKSWFFRNQVSSLERPAPRTEARHRRLQGHQPRPARGWPS